MIGLLGAYVRTDLRAIMRVPAFLVPTLAFPVLLYVFFGLPYAHDPQTAAVLMASYAAYGVLGVAIFQFGVNIANERGTSWERFVRLLPAPIGIRMTSRMITASVFAIATAVCVVACALLFGHARPSIIGVVSLFVVLLAAGIPFTLLGIALGYWSSPKGAVPLANLIYLPLSLAGGLWIPPAFLPKIIKAVSPYMPTRHFGELVWAAVLAQPIPLASCAWLAGYSVLFGAIAYFGFRREQARRYA
ncbi:MAG TPA: ABC transporter permease [Candidatus Elarobacter sp.]|jgi:ABC-2 type transport system permease protein